MAEYIEREAVRMAMDYIKDNYGADFTELNDIVSKLPAANVRENVKGIWNKRDSWFWYCSACGEPLCVTTDGIDNFDKDPNFCPNCGAEMRGGNDD